MRRAAIPFVGLLALMLGMAFTGGGSAAGGAQAASDEPPINLYAPGRDYGRFPIGTEFQKPRDFQVVNRGEETVKLGKLKVVGQGAKSISFYMDFCSGELLEPGKSCEMGMYFRAPRKPAKVAARLSFGGVLVDGPGYRATVVGPAISLLKPPKRIPASGRFPMAKIYCPVACEMYSLPTAKMGRYTFGLWDSGPKRLKAGKRGVRGARFVGDLKRRLRSHGKALVTYQVCATVLKTKVSTCSKRVKFRVRG